MNAKKAEGAGGKMTLLKVLKADMTSPFQGFKFECQKWYHCPDFDLGDDECSNGFYATPIDGLHYAYRPGRRVFVAEVRGQSRVFDCMKQRYEDIMLTDELTADQIKQMAIDAEQRVGYRLSEVLFPVNPLLLPKAIPTDADIIMLKQWASVGDSVFSSVWDSVWDSVGASVFSSVWASVGDSVFSSVWASVEDSVGASVFSSVWASVSDGARDSAWSRVWASVEDSVGASVRDSVWDSVGAYIGSLFPAITKWEYVNHTPGIYPFQSAANLWRRGLVPSYDGKQWRLHSGPTAEIVWEEK
jgi:hypothetical protein